VFFQEPADNLTSKPNNSHKLRPNLDEQLNNGRSNLLYDTTGWNGLTNLLLVLILGNTGSEGTVSTSVSIFSTFVFSPVSEVEVDIGG
jgi:hypothetical protein